MPLIYPIAFVGGNTARTWTTLVTVSGLASSAGFGNRDRREWFAAAALAAVSGTQIRVTFRPNNSTSATISSAYVGMQGAAAPNFDDNQKQLLFGGSSSVTLVGGAADTVSDSLVFTYTSGHPIIVSYEMSASPFSAVQATGLGANFSDWSTGSVGLSAGNGPPDTSGGSYASGSGALAVVFKIEVS